MHILAREGDTWDETIVSESDVYQTIFLHGREVRPDERLGPASAD